VKPFKMSGLKAHHPMGFLAACGLLRCLTEWRDFGVVKLSWDGSRSEGRIAVLHADRALDITSVAQVLLCWSRIQRDSVALKWSTKIDDREKFRRCAKTIVESVNDDRSRRDADLLAALASDVIYRREKGMLKLEPTAFDLTSASQNFLKSVREVAGEPKNSKGKADLLTKEAVEEALIGPWMYRDSYHSLGWDPATQRLHALRGKLPAADTERRSVRAAVFLAAQALPLFPCFAVRGHLRTTGFYRLDGEDWFVWPIWTAPVSLDTLRSLVVQRFDEDLQNLRERGIDVVYRCRVCHTGGAEGNYQVFSYPEEWPWPR
jgi:hypothetical protein